MSATADKGKKSGENIDHLTLRVEQGTQNATQGLPTVTFTPHTKSTERVKSTKGTKTHPFEIFVGSVTLLELGALPGTDGSVTVFPTKTDV